MQIVKRILWVICLFFFTKHIAYSQNVIVSMPDTLIVASNNEIKYPIHISNLSPDSLLGFTFTLQYNSDIIDIVDYEVTSLSNGFFIQHNPDQSGVYRITGANSRAINEDGVLLKLVVEVIGEGVSPVNFEQASINEGVPELVVSNGEILISSYETAPAIISPTDGQENLPRNIALHWTSNPLYSKYEVQYSRNQALNPVTVFTNIEDTTLVLQNLEYLETYYWRVRAISDLRVSNWTEIRSFKIREEENSPPIVKSKLGTIEVEEDFGNFTVAFLDTVFNDVETEMLEYELVESTEIVSAKISNRNLILTSLENLYGNGQVVIKATDDEGLEVRDTLYVTVNSVNDLPYFEDLPDTLAFVSGDELIFEFEELVLDVEDDLSGLTFEFSIDPSEISFNVSITSHSVTISAPDFTGEGILTLKVTDSDGGQAEATIVVLVETISSSRLDEALPQEFKLSQNYPNPFNPTTQIEYQLPEAVTVNLRIYDMTGRIVYSNLNKQKAAGKHSISFDASSLSSGIYLYELSTSKFIKTKKMTLIK